MNSTGMPSSRPTSGLPLALESDFVVSSTGGTPDTQQSMAKPHRPLHELIADYLVVAVLSPFIALATTWMPRFLLAILILDIPLQLQGHLFFREDDAARGALGGLNISVTTIALAGLYASWFLRAKASRDCQARPSLQINMALTLYLTISAFSWFVAQDVGLAFFEFFLLLQLYLVYLYVANCVRTRQDVLFVVSLLLVGCVLASLAIINIKLAGYPPILMGRPWGLPTRVQIEDYGGVMRIGGTVGSPNNAGGYLSIVLALAVGVLFANLGRAPKLLATVVLAVGSPALILTFSRGGWLAFALSITAMLFFFTGRMRLFSWKAPAAGIGLLALLYLPFHGAVSERMFGDDRGSAESRIPLMKLAFRIIEDNPVLGVGSNNFSVVMDRYIIPELRGGFVYAVHNKYLLVWAETGTLGLLAYIIFLLGTLRKGWQCWQLNQGFLSTIGLAFAAAIAGHMFQMGVDVFNGRPVAQLLLLAAGLLNAMHRICATNLPADHLSSMT
jgi:putative inorganic carbon (HCO3(-)) transporter